MECMTVGGVTEHLTALQGIADANGGNRASGMPGHTASADYVSDRLEAAGYSVTRQAVRLRLLRADRHADVRADRPDRRLNYAYSKNGIDGDFQDMSYSGSGTVTGTVVPVDIASADSGCEATDFTAAVSGEVALIKRGACDFAVKAAERRGGRRHRGDHLQRRRRPLARGPDRRHARRPGRDPGARHHVRARPAVGRHRRSPSTSRRSARPAAPRTSSPSSPGRPTTT